MGHARAILGAETAAQQIAAWRTVIAKDLSVRDTERLIKRLKDTPAKPQDPELPETSEARYLVDVADELSLQFGTRVKINRHGKKGKVEIDFFNDDDLDRLLGLLRQVDADVEA
jgi:ParB family chromosome partitioning protein